MPALAAGLLAGCLSRSGPPKLYFLSASAPAPAPAATPGDGQPFMVDLRMSCAEYLRAKQMLVQSGPNQLRASEDDLWRETPQAGFARILAERFAQNLPDCQLTPQVFATTNTPELILEIDLRSLQGRLQPAREAEVSAEIRILDAHEHLLEQKELRLTSPWSQGAGPDDYQALAAAESRAAAQLADEIGQKVLAWHRKMLKR
jgi:uncharacterized lipoprotein YmbA